MPKYKMAKYSQALRKKAKRNFKRKYQRKRKSNFARKNVKTQVSARAPMVECKKRTLGVLSGFINPANYLSTFPHRDRII